MALTTNILLQFPPPPPSGNVTVLEQEGLMKDVAESIPFSIPEQPEVWLQADTQTGHNSKLDSAQMAFLHHDHSVWKRARHAWSRAGVLALLEEINDSKEEVSPWVHTIFSQVLLWAHHLTNVKDTLCPQRVLSSTELVHKYCHVTNWPSSPVQALAWHPHVTKLAVAVQDDSIHVFGSASGVNPVLKHKLQKQVADLAWQPMSASVLAVACQSCVLLWHVEPNSLALRPSTSTVQILSWPGHVPVTSLAWHPDGDHLVSASPRQGDILIWEVTREVCIPLRRGANTGVALLQYSPDGSKLFTGTTSTLFRVWETKTWHAEVWSQLSGRCSAACWSPDGTVLVFAMCGESILYAVRYSQTEGLSVVGSSVILADISALNLHDTAGREVRTGGEVQGLVWDKTGERLAVLFQPSESGSNSLVAVFKSTVHPVLQLLPGGFVRGKTGENAHHIAFQPSFNKGALLSVVWSSGRVAYVPMHFVPAEEIHQMAPRTPHLGHLSPMSPHHHHIPRERF